MKILYGIQGTGNGHITRARVMAKALKEKNVDVDYIFSGREQDKYFDMEIFGDYQTFHGFTFGYKHGKIDYVKTGLNLRLGRFLRDVKAIDMSKYDLVINDFEPVSAWAAKRAGVPVINISHQAVFTKPNVPVKGMGWLNRNILKYFAPSNIAIGVHWFHFDENIIPPFIEREVESEEQSEDVLVYMPFEDLDEIKYLLAEQYNYNFIIYHPEVTEDKYDNGLTLRQPSRNGFLKELSRCNGVIANAGFELSSEALCLGKKLLLKPLDGQFEQLSNAETLKQLGLASVMLDLDDEELALWLKRENNQSINFPSDAGPLVDWILSGDHQNPQSLCDQLWQPVKVPKVNVAS